MPGGWSGCQPVPPSVLVTGAPEVNGWHPAMAASAFAGTPWPTTGCRIGKGRCRTVRHIEVGVRPSDPRVHSRRCRDTMAPYGKQVYSGLCQTAGSWSAPGCQPAPADVSAANRLVPALDSPMALSSRHSAASR